MEREDMIGKRWIKDGEEWGRGIKKRTEQSSWHDGWLTGFNKLDVPYKYECFLSLSPKSLPLPLDHSVLVWLKKQTLTCHQFPPSQPWETDTEKERERERGRKKSLITRKCWRGSGAPVRQLRSSWHTHVYIQRHTHTHTLLRERGLEAATTDCKTSRDNWNKTGRSRKTVEPPAAHSWRH